MLFSTIEEIKKYLPATAAFDFPALLPFIVKAETDDIIPWLSQEQYDDINATYDSGNGIDDLSEQQLALLDKIRRPLANVAFLKYIPFGNVTIGKAGISVAENTTQKIASQWRIEDLKQACEDDYYKGIEAMLLFLEENIEDFDDWAQSSAYTVFKECFINTAKEFSDVFTINGSRRVFLAVKPIMKRMEEKHILTVTGKGLFDALKEQILDADLTDVNKKLLPFIHSAVANFTMSRALLELPLAITGAGIQIVMRKAIGDNSIETETASDTKLSALHSAAMRDAELSKKELTDFLYKYYTDYPLYQADTSVYAAPPGSVNEDKTKSTLLL